MDKVVLKATKRTVVGKQVKQLRRQGLLPAVIYGHNVEPVTISLNAHEAGLTISKLTSSSLVTIDVEGMEYPTLIREKQKNYIKGILTHVDFLAVSLTEKLSAYVGIEFSGVAPAVKDFNAIIVHNMDKLEVECFPQDLPEKIVVDISGLKTIGASIHVRDIVVSDKVKILDDADEIVVVATAQKAEAVEETAGEIAEPEVIEKGKKEEEEAE